MTRLCIAFLDWLEADPLSPFKIAGGGLVVFFALAFLAFLAST